MFDWGVSKLKQFQLLIFQRSDFFISANKWVGPLHVGYYYIILFGSLTLQTFFNFKSIISIITGCKQPPALDGGSQT